MKRYGFSGWICRDGTCEPDFVEHKRGPYVLYSEAQARIEALEWLVEVQLLEGWIMAAEYRELITGKGFDEYFRISRAALAATEDA